MPKQAHDDLIPEGLADKWELLKEICIASQLTPVESLSSIDGLDVTTSETVDGLRVAVRSAPGEKCERCWTISPTVGQDADHAALCGRCAEVVRSLAA